MSMSIKESSSRLDAEKKAGITARGLLNFECGMNASHTRNCSRKAAPIISFCIPNVER